MEVHIGDSLESSSLLFAGRSIRSVPVSVVVVLPLLARLVAGVCPGVDFLELLDADFGVDLRRAQAGVSEHLLESEELSGGRPIFCCNNQT
jgi:hypothetical protein